MSYLAYRFSIFLSGRLVYTVVTLPPDRADLFLFPRLYRAAADPMTYVFAHGLAVNGGADSILHHLQPGDDGVLDPGNLDHRFHCLFVRIFPRRPDVSHRHHAVGSRR